ncbi:MAG: hypothetical protein LBD23_11975 [Oscillospiraceae bacterium]|jgi:hypothetical protein|nr:hypothetical protein [Oscillospiraceae bacterium]
MPKKIKVVEDSMIRDKIKKIFTLQRLDYVKLAAKFCEENYSITSSNLRMYIEDQNRTFNIDFLYVFSKVCCVSLDYLVNPEFNVDDINGFDYNFFTPRYDKYHGKYWFYWFSTTENIQKERPKRTELEIKNNTQVILKLHPHDDRLKGIANKEKYYRGNIILSESPTMKAFLYLRDTYGDVLQVILNDQTFEGHNVEFALGIAVSVSSGEMKRLPVAHRVCISRKTLTLEGEKFLAPHLNLNNKFINIEEDALRKLLTEFYPTKADMIISQLIEDNSKSKKIISLGEGSLKDIFRLNLDTFESVNLEDFISKLRSRCYLSQVSTKIKPELDSTLFLHLTNNNYFETNKNEVE